MSNLKLLLGLSLSLTTAGCLDGTGPGHSDEDILGGQIDNGDPSVVQIRYAFASPQGLGEAGCTGTFITPTVLLTAAHCANGWNYQYNTATTADPFSNSAGWVNAQYALANPAYDGTSADGHDVALVVLGQPAAIAPSPLGTVPAVGQTVHAVGYGWTQPGTSGTGGTKMHKMFTVSSVAAHEWVAGPNDTCHGDSGGPVFDLSGTIIGATSYGDSADCNGNDHFMRIDDNRAWIDSILAQLGGSSSGGGSGSGSGGGGGTSSQCDSISSVNGSSVEVKCSNGQCECYQDSVLVNTCTENAASCSIPGSCCGF
jgi:V8-like Glu-specific endopeptidase